MSNEASSLHGRRQLRLDLHVGRIVRLLDCQVEGQAARAGAAASCASRLHCALEPHAVRMFGTISPAGIRQRRLGTFELAGQIRAVRLRRLAGVRGGNLLLQSLHFALQPHRRPDDRDA